MNKQETAAILEELGIKNISTIKKDCSVDVDGDVDINKCFTIKKARKLLIKFGHVKGNFNCSISILESLEGVPHECHDFNCSGNRLKSLHHAPLIVNGNFTCYMNKGISLNGAPKIIYGACSITNCDLTNLLGLETTIIHGDANFSDNRLRSISGLGAWNSKLILPNNQITHLDKKLLDSGRVDVSDNPISQENIETNSFW